MESLSKKIQNLGIHDIRNAARFAQNVIVQYEPYQVDIRRATNTDSWGPTSKHLAKVLRNRYQVPLYLMTEYILKRLVDHIASRPKNLYEKARKDYVNYGAEWRVVLKCLIVVEFLLLNVEEGEELNQVKSCLLTHKHILSSQVSNYKIPFSNDGKMEIHERGIRKKSEYILKFLDDSRFLKEERKRNRKNVNKIHSQQSTAFVPTSNEIIFNANAIDSTESNTIPNNNNNNINMDFDIEDISMQNEVRTHSKTSNAVDEQRRQRREILRERIRNNELQRQRSIKRSMSQKQQPQSNDIPDLLDMDFDESSANTAPPMIESTSNDDNNNNNNFGENVWASNNNNNNNDDDDDFGDFQSGTNDSSALAITSNVLVTTSANKSVVPSNNNNASSNLNDLLDLGASSTTNTNTNTNNTNTNNNNADAFDDLFNFSKSLI